MSSLINYFCKWSCQFPFADIKYYTLLVHEILIQSYLMAVSWKKSNPPCLCIRFFLNKPLLIWKHAMLLWWNEPAQVNLLCYMESMSWNQGSWSPYSLRLQIMHYGGLLKASESFNVFIYQFHVNFMLSVSSGSFFKNELLI